MEIETELKVYRVKKQCPECEKGFMSSVTTTNHNYSHMNLYDHRCDQCGHPETYKTIYPKLEYKDK